MKHGHMDQDCDIINCNVVTRCIVASTACTPENIAWESLRTVQKILLGEDWRLFDFHKCNQSGHPSPQGMVDSGNLPSEDWQNLCALLHTFKINPLYVFCGFI